MDHVLTRREALRRAGAGVGAATVMSNSLIAKALAAAPSCGTLGDIEHVVILIQENRSFDHYFGSYRGVRGFADPNVKRLGDGSGLSIFAQPGYPGGFDGGHSTRSTSTRTPTASAQTTSTTAGVPNTRIGMTGGSTGSSPATSPSTARATAL
jgi:phospholipase C